MPFASYAGLALAAALLPVAAHGQAATPVATPAPSLAVLKDEIRAGQFSNVHSVLIDVHGKQVAEWYFSGDDARRGVDQGVVAFDANTLHDIRSSTKSIVSLLFGIALKDGAIKSLDTPIFDYFPEYKDLQTPQTVRITLRDLLRMSSGLHWDEYSFPYTDPRNSENAMDAAPDRIRYLLSLASDTAPGTRFRYSGGDVALIGAVIARATKMPLDDFARIKLFAPLGIGHFEWTKDDHGVPIAASGLRMRPADMMAMGELVRNHGRYRGRQIVARDWIDAATSRQIGIDTGSPCGAEGTDRPAGLGYLQYGYFWWGGPGCADRQEDLWFGAMGNGGQRITVDPARDAVIVTTAGLYDSPEQGKVNVLVQAIERTLPLSPGAAKRPEGQ